MKGFFYSWDCKRKKINQDCDGPLSLQLHSLSLSSLLAHFNYEPWRGRKFTCSVIFRLFCIPLSLKLFNFTKRTGNEENSISSSKKWNFAVQVRYRLCADVYIGGKQGETINISRGDSPPAISRPEVSEPRLKNQTVRQLTRSLRLLWISIKICIISNNDMLEDECIIYQLSDNGLK